MILILDIDGTLADLTHREFLVADKDHADWDTFFSDELIYKDQVIPGALEGYEAFYDLADFIYIISGRPERSLDRTEEWLIENGFDISKVLGSIILRPDDLISSSREFKQAVMDAVIIPKHGPAETYVFIDDEPKNLEMFSEYGLALKAPEIWKDIV
jgi:hypothetical protein